MLIDREASTSLSVAAIERQIVVRLAEWLERDAAELERELRMADRDLPVDSEDLRHILAALEADFDVALPYDAMLALRLSYAHDLATFIHRRRVRMSAGTAAKRVVLRGGRGGGRGGAARKPGGTR